MFQSSWPLRRRPLLAAALLAAVLVAPGCKKKKAEDDGKSVAGSGVAKTEERTLPPFTSLRVGGVVQATYKLGNPHLALRGDDNLLPLIKVETTPNRVWLKQEATLKPTMSLSADISGPALTELIVDTVARVTVEGLHAERLRVQGAGAGKISIKGSADELEVVADLAADLDLTGLSVRKARVTAKTAANVKLGYVEELDVEARGAARVSYTGDPKITRSEGRRPAKRN